jgi:two-component system, LytTR family, response regulator AlgR
LVPLDEIDCFVAEDGYVMARSARVEGFVDASLQELEQRLGDAVLRVHRGCLAVANSIAGVVKLTDGHHYVLFADGFDNARLSRRQMAPFRKYLGGIR